MFFGELLHYFVPLFSFQRNWDAYNSTCHRVIVKTEWGNIYKMHNTLHIISSQYVLKIKQGYEYLFVTDFIR